MTCNKKYTLQLGTGKKCFFNTVIITGMCRVGKTLLGNIISSCQNVEYAEEPYPLQFLPFIQDCFNNDSSVLKSFWQSYLVELFQNTCLLRCVSFRPSDLSYIGHKKTQEEILSRFENINNIFDVQRKLHEQLFVIALAESCFAYENLTYFSENSPIIYVIRHPYAVALDVYKKQWYTDKYLHETHVGIAVKIYEENSKKYIVPFWVGDGEEEFFLSLNDMDRAVFYWCCFAQKYIEMLNNYDGVLNLYTYENITSHPFDSFADIRSYFNLKDGTFTQSILEKVYTQKVPSVHITNYKLKQLCLEIVEQLDVGYLL